MARFLVDLILFVLWSASEPLFAALFTVTPPLCSWDTLRWIHIHFPDRLLLKDLFRPWCRLRRLHASTNASSHESLISLVEDHRTCWDFDASSLISVSSQVYWPSSTWICFCPDPYRTSVWSRMKNPGLCSFFIVLSKVPAQSSRLWRRMLVLGPILPIGSVSIFSWPFPFLVVRCQSLFLL